MVLIVTASEEKIKKLVRNKFNFLIKLFNFDPNKVYPYNIQVNILDNLEKFLEIYKKEYKTNPPNYVVGFTVSNERIFILSENLFEKKEHSKKEFKKVITHELCHIFVRRILNPKHTFRWIEEGICQYIAFRGQKFIIKKFISFKKLEKKEDWKKYTPYQQAAKFFEFLDKKFGMNKIIDFIKLIKFKDEYEAFKEVFGDFEIIEDLFLRDLKEKNENKAPSGYSL